MKGFRMTDEYKKLHANLAVLGSAIKKVEAHLAKHPARNNLFVNISKDYFDFHPDGGLDYEARQVPLSNEDKIEVLLGMDINGSDTLCVHYAEINVPDGITPTIDTLFKLGDLPSDEMIAYSKILPRLIWLADKKILELADEAENIAGGIEQALAAAAKKPERKPKAKAKA